MSHPSETLHQPRDQVRNQDLRNQSTHTQLMEVMLHLQQTVEDYITQLKTQHLQPDLELQRHSQAAREQEATLVRLMCQVVNLLQPCPPLDSSGHVGGGQQAQSSRQPDQLGHHLSDLQATVVSCDLSTRGSDISALYHSSIQGYKTYQGDKYHEDKNPLVRMEGAHSRAPITRVYRVLCQVLCSLAYSSHSRDVRRCYRLLIDSGMGTEMK